jgi:transglutaminase-like putative cysteine protease
MRVSKRAVFLKLVSVAAISFMVMSTLGVASGVVAEGAELWSKGNLDPGSGSSSGDPVGDITMTASDTVDIENLPDYYREDKGLVLIRSASTWVMDENTTQNISISWMVINADIEGRDAENVLIVDDFDENITVWNSTPAASVDGNHYVWNLGKIPSNGTVNITINLQATMPIDADAVQLDAGAVLFATKDGEPVYNDFTRMVEYSTILEDYLRSTVDADFNDPEIQGLQAIVGGDVDLIFEFVRDEIDYDSYTGSLRGARGTYWSYAGNSYDKVNLLVALLRNAGIPCRYVHGTLSNPLAKEIIGSMFPVRSDNIIGYTDDHDAENLSTPSSDPTLLAETTDHMWVEYYVGNGVWEALDPSFKNAGLGDSYTVPDGNWSEMPDNWRHKVTIKVLYEKRDLYWESTSGLSLALGEDVRDTSLTSTLVVAGLVGRNVYLTHKVDSRYNNYAPFLGYLGYTTSYKPILFIQDEIKADKYTGKTYSEQFYLAFNLDTFDTEITGSWLQIQVSSPGQNVQTFERPIFDKIGFVTRYYDPYGGVAPKNMAPQITEIDLYTITVAPSFISGAFINKAKER